MTKPRRPRGIFASDPRYKKIAAMVWDLHCWHNPAVYFDGTEEIEAGLMDRPEYQATRQLIEDDLEEALTELETDNRVGPFRDYVNSL